MPQVVPLGYSNATLNQIIGTDLLSQPGIVADLQQYWLPVTFSNGSAAVTLGNTLTGTYTVTASKNSSELIIVGATPLTLALHRGHPISVTLGASTWSGIVESVYNSGGNQTIGINSAAGSPAAVSALASQALNVGVRLTSADQGKSIYIMGAFPLLHGPIISTIGTVTSANTLTLSGVVSNGDAASLTPMMVAWGTDNYAALSSVINASVQAGSRVLVVNGGIYTSKWPSAVVNMMLRGSGKIFVPPLGFTTDYSSTDALSPSQIKKPVIPLYAPESPPPETTMRGEDLFSKMAGVSSPNVVFVGASTFTSDPGGAGMASSPVRLIRNRLQRMNIGRKSFKFFEFAAAGQKVASWIPGYDATNGAAKEMFTKMAGEVAAPAEGAATQAPVVARNYMGEVTGAAPGEAAYPTTAPTSPTDNAWYNWLQGKAPTPPGGSPMTPGVPQQYIPAMRQMLQQGQAPVPGFAVPNGMAQQMRNGLQRAMPPQLGPISPGAPGFTPAPSAPFAPPPVLNMPNGVPVGYPGGTP